MAGIDDWSTTPADNKTADGGITWVEEQNPPMIHHSARVMMARIAEWKAEFAAVATSGDAADLTGTLAVARLADRSIPVHKLTIRDFSNLIQNPDFEFEGGWNFVNGYTRVNDPTNAFVGNFVVANTSTTASRILVQEAAGDALGHRISISPGDGVFAAAQLKVSAGWAGTLFRLRIQFVDKDGGVISTINGANISPASYAESFVDVIAPASAASFQVQVLLTQTAGTAYVGAVYGAIKRPIDRISLIASQAEAEAGTANDKAMTPLRTQQNVNVHKNAATAHTATQVEFQPTQTGAVNRSVHTILNERFKFRPDNYGAVFDSLNSANTTANTLALVTAAARLRDAGGGQLVFPQAEFLLVEPYLAHSLAGTDERTVLWFNEAGLELTVEGNGCALIMDGANRTQWGNFIRGGVLGKDSRVRLRNLRFNYKNAPFVIGVVSAISAGSHIDVVVDEAPAWDRVQRCQRYSALGEMAEYVATYQVRNTGLTSGMPFTLQSGSTYRLNISTTDTVDLSSLVVGSIVMLEHHVGGRRFAATSSYRAGYIDLENLEVNDTAGSAHYVQGAYRLEASHCISRPSKPRRVHKSHATDGIHCNFVSECHVHDCNTQWNGDDGINLSSSVAPVTSRDSNTTFTFTDTDFEWPPHERSLLQILDASRVLQAELRVVSATETATNTWQVTVDGTLPAAMNNTWEIVGTVEVATIKGGTFANNRGRGILISGRVVDIVGSTVFGTTGPGIGVPSDEQVHTHIKRMRISGPEIFNVASGGANPAIAINAFHKDGTTVAAAGTYGKIVVDGATIDGANNSGVRIIGATTAIVTGSKFADVARSPSTILGLIGGVPISARNCSLLHLDGNTMTDASDGTVAANNVTTVRWGNNPRLLPSRGTNPVTIASSPTAEAARVAEKYTIITADATTSLVFGTHGAIIKDTAALTAIRQRNFAASASQVTGDRIHFVCATTGGFASRLRDAGTATTIKDLVADQWADIMWNGTAWELVRFGSLT